MIDLNIEHPDFDMAMELLCSISQAPHSTTLESLRSDLGLDTLQEVVDLADELKRRGIKVRSLSRVQLITAKGMRKSPKNDGRVLFIPRKGGGAIIQAAEKYWNLVNEN